MNPTLDIKTTSAGIVFKIRVQPKASRNEICGIHDDALKVRLTAPPVDNAANTLCLKFLAKALDLPRSRLEIVSGHTGRTKQILVRWPEDAPPETAGPAIINQIESLVVK